MIFRFLLFFIVFFIIREFDREFEMEKYTSAMLGKMIVTSTVLRRCHKCEVNVGVVHPLLMGTIGLKRFGSQI